MKESKQQWTNLFCQESEDDFISKLNFSGNMNMNKDLFDISSEVCFANRFLSFDEQKSLKESIFNDPLIKTEDQCGAMDNLLKTNSQLIVTDIREQRINQKTDNKQTNDVKKMESTGIKEEVKIPHPNYLQAKSDATMKSNIQKNDKRTYQVNRNRKSQKGSSENIAEKLILKRFGRTQDRDLFSKLKEYCASAGRQVSEFFTEGKNLDQQLNEILNLLLSSISWKGSKKLLHLRIKSIASRTEFSFRERKLLRLMIIEQIETNSIDFTKFEYYFPAILDEKMQHEIELILSELVERQSI